MKKKNLMDYYKVGDPICETRFGNHGTVLKVSKMSVTFKMKSSTKKITLHTIDAAESTYKSHPTVVAPI